jgi:glutaredoxin
MALIPDQVRTQLKERFQQRLTGPVKVSLYTRPGSSRLVLPSGLGCPTCEDAKEMAQLLHESAPDKVSLEVIDVARDSARAEVDEVGDVPTISIGVDSQPARIRFQGLPTGGEFPPLIEAVERVSSGEHGLNPNTVQTLAKVNEPIEVMVFATPT